MDNKADKWQITALILVLGIPVLLYTILELPSILYVGYTKNVSLIRDVQVGLTIVIAAVLVSLEMWIWKKR
ncbi:hypothetical protein LLE49_13890 [Alicyclobacillus tolerans]|uniref:hypothetical protein n=1 Tax=Alicyclobacillus tolerans TaxID=90970 RepID=UPI001F3B570D|nr:hypothetical protein [Alicyclobacillus tolerans]MCF8565811.1 hypothetical protein [Alicyclobacillus tolerans]